MKIENLNLQALKEFAKLYDVYEVLDFEDPHIMDTKEKEFGSNFKAVQSSLKPLTELVDGIDPTTPTTFITFQVVAQKLVTEKRYSEVQVNLKRWQEILKLVDGNDETIRLLSIFTGYK